MVAFETHNLKVCGSNPHSASKVSKLMKSSVEWWNHIKTDEVLLNDWLKDQYHGEATSSKRIRDFAKDFCSNPKYSKILEIIATQEDQHASWVGELLQSRGLPAEILERRERYWDAVTSNVDSFEGGTAVAAHAEEMRLERIRVIANDVETPTDIRVAFRKILKDEMFHAIAFRSMTTDEAYAKTSPAHVMGLEMLGLIL